MSEPEKDEKTEQATPKRRQEFRDRGEVAKSRELISAMMLLASAGALWKIIDNLQEPLQRLSMAAFGRLHDYENFVRGPASFFESLAGEVAGAIAMPLGLLAAAALGANLMQTGWMFTTKVFEFKLNKFNPINGVKRLFFSKDTVANVVKSLLKVGLLGAVAAGALAGTWREVGALVARTPMGFAEYLMRVSLTPLAACSLVMVVVGVLDFMWQRHQMEERMKMTKDELKRELKQSQGDPLIRGRRRAKHAELLSVNQMVQETAEATIVVNNPTHVSVALRYRPEEGAPIVVAKGVDHVALKIREVADAHDVPMVTNIPLARGLHGSCEVGQYIPEEFFRAVAEVLAHLYANRR